MIFRLVVNNGGGGGGGAMVDQQSNRARKCVTINGVTPRDWSSLVSKRDNWGLDTRIIHNKIINGICILHCCTLWFR